MNNSKDNSYYDKLAAEYDSLRDNFVVDSFVLDRKNNDILLRMRQLMEECPYLNCDCTKLRRQTYYCLDCYKVRENINYEV